MTAYLVRVRVLLNANDPRDAAARAIEAINNPDRCVALDVEPRNSPTLEVTGPSEEIYLNPEEYPALPNCPRCGTRISR